MLEGLEKFGSLLVVGQTLMMLPAMHRLRVDNAVQGMSIWTMAFYCFASLYYVPVFWMSELYWTAVAVAVLGVVELTWVVWAAFLPPVDGQKLD
jgi:hypothetical protein